jgi:hypothetical protein
MWTALTFNVATALLAEDYRSEVTTLSKQEKNLHKLLGNPHPPTFYFSSTPIAGSRSGLVEVSSSYRLSTADWPVLGRVLPLPYRTELISTQPTSHGGMSLAV